MKTHSKADIDSAYARIRVIRDKYVESPRDAEVRTGLDMLLANRELNLVSAKPDNKMGLLVTGESGAGKSTLLSRLFSTHPDLSRDGLPETDLPLCSLRIEPPISLKTLGLQTLRKLEYHAMAGWRSTKSGYWDDVRNQHEIRKTKVQHFDEAQDVFESASARDILEILRTIKGLMSSTSAPTIVVLSGGPELETYLEQDRMLLRRFIKAPLAPISMDRGRKGVMKQIAEFSTDVGLTAPADTAELAARIIHAAAFQLGRSMEIIVDAILECVLAGKSALDSDDFAGAYERQTACNDALNIFKAPDWRSIKSLHTAEIRVPTAIPKGRRSVKREDSKW